MEESERPRREREKEKDRYREREKERERERKRGREREREKKKERKREKERGPEAMFLSRGSLYSCVCQSICARACTDIHGGKAAAAAQAVCVPTTQCCLYLAHYTLLHTLYYWPRYSLNAASGSIQHVANKIEICKHLHPSARHCVH
jgi:hypothetical protein